MSTATEHPSRSAAGLAYSVAGDGPPLVLLHGLGSSSRAFARVVPGLAEHFTTYAVDLPGFGRSPMPDPEPHLLAPRDLSAAVESWMDELGLDRVHLAGNSMGGWTSLELAADGRALSVTALCPAGLWVPLTDRSPLMDGNRRAAQFLRPVVPFVFRSPVLRRIGFGAAVERFDLLDADTAIAAALDQADAVGFHAAHDGMIGLWFDRSDDIDHDVPVTIVFGAADRIIPAGTAREREHTPIHSRWITLPRCGHVPMWDAPEETVRIVRDTARV